MSLASRAFLEPPRLRRVSGFRRRHALQGFSIELGDPQNPLTLDYNQAGGLSAAAALSNGKKSRH